MSKPIEYTRVEPNINYGLWMIMMFHFKFINYNKCTSLAIIKFRANEIENRKTVEKSNKTESCFSKTSKKKWTDL